MIQGRRLGDGAMARELALLALLVVMMLAAGADAPGALASTAAPHWRIVSESLPTRFTAGAASDAYVLIVRNDGARRTGRGEAIALTDTLPAGVSASGIAARGEEPNGLGFPEFNMSCPVTKVTGTFTCTYDAEAEKQPAVLPGAVVVVTIPVSVPEDVATLTNEASIAGGGAPEATTEEKTTIEPTPAPFALSLFDMEAVGETGEADTQAGSHPFELTTTLAFTVLAREVIGASESLQASAAPKDLEVALPPGLVGNANAVPRCSQRAFLEGETTHCPLDSQVGTIKPFFYGRFLMHPAPVYDVVPPPGQLAELGFASRFGRAAMFLHVRSNGDYGLAVALNDIPETGPLQGAILTLWGVPASSTHDLEREGALGEGRAEGEFCSPKVEVNAAGVEEAQGCPDGAGAKPFLTLPSACQEMRLAEGVEDDTWEDPSLEAFPEELLPTSAITGCEQLPFTPSLTLAPETTQAGAPSGYTLGVRLPQNESPSALASADVRSVQVALPAGVTLSPSFANGLQACSHEQFAPPPSERNTAAPAACPSRSQIGTVKIATPLLASPLEGEVYVGEPACTPCGPTDAQEGRLLRLLVQAQGAGLTVKLEGAASIDQATGQLTVRFEQIPQLPFEDVQLTLDGGANAPLVNSSSACGTPLTASARLTPYGGETPAQPTSEPITLVGCPSPRFQPAFTAGTTNDDAGAFSPLAVAFARGEGEEGLRSFSVRLAPGLLAMLSKVHPCPEAQAQVSACIPQSQIGTVTITAGAGADPLQLTGSVYLTGPRAGAPFGLSIVVPAVAGPLSLGTIEVGASIAVNPRTAALSIVSEPLPQSVDGIPLQIRTVALDIDRAGFVFNPTDCRTLAIAGTLTSAQGATAAVSSRFQAADCATLRFRPRLTALTHAHAGRQDGVHLHVRVVSASGQANIAELKLDLPKRMVPRLSTLQEACPVSVFDDDPASCPASSVVGSATVLTPLVRQPFDGPVYVLSRGGKAAPEIALVLQGEGIVLEVVGEAKVRKGIESVAFRALPDVPFSELDVLLDAGRHSLLGANLPAKAHGSLCAGRLAMPSEITAQDGAVVKQTTIVSVSGCGGPHGRRKAKSGRKARAGKGRA